MVDVRDIEEILKDYDLYQDGNKPDCYLPIDDKELAAVFAEKLIPILQKSQPKVVRCAACNTELSYGKFFDPLLRDMTIIVNVCECGG